jgi:hypothetical protein
MGLNPKHSKAFWRMFFKWFLLANSSEEKSRVPLDVAGFIGIYAIVIQISSILAN